MNTSGHTSFCVSLLVGANGVCDYDILIVPVPEEANAESVGTSYEQAWEREKSY